MDPLKSNEQMNIVPVANVNPTIVFSQKKIIDTVDKEIRLAVDLIYKEEFTSESLPSLIEGINSSDFLKQLRGCLGIRRIIADPNIPSPIRHLLDQNSIQRLHQIIQLPSIILQNEAAWCFSNLASGSEAETKAVAERETLELLSKLLNSEYQELQLNAIWAFANLCGDNDNATIDIIMELGIFNSILEIVTKTKKLILFNNGCWFLRNMCRANKSQSRFRFKEMVIPFCKFLKLNSEENEGMYDSVKGFQIIFSQLKEGSEEAELKEIIKLMIKYNFLQSISVQMRTYSIKTRPLLITYSLQILGDICSGETQDKDAVVESGVLPAIYKLLNHSNDQIQLESCKTLRNLSSNSTQIISIILEKREVIESILTIISSQERKCNTQWQAANLILNCVQYGCDFDVRNLLALDLFKSLNRFLKFDNSFNNTKIGIDIILAVLESTSTITDSNPKLLNPYLGNFNNSGILQAINLIKKYQYTGEINDKIKKILQLTGH